MILPSHSHSVTLQTLISEVYPSALQPLLSQFLSGDISAAVALMYLLIETRSLEKVSIAVNNLAVRVDALPDSGSRHRELLKELAELIKENQDGCGRITDMLLADVDTDEPAPSVEAGIAFCKRLFDWSVQQSPEASVALYSLGNPEILAAATGEVVDKMEEWGLLKPEHCALEIGCGIGRFQSALATRLQHITGIDVSAQMIKEAQTRCAGLANVHLEESPGYDLAQFPAHSFGLVFAVDSFPYLCQSGMPLVEAHFHEAARVLKPDGDFLILNFSYRNNPLLDHNDVNRLAAMAGFAVVLNGAQPFALWDGVAFHLRLRR
ncbi:MAG: class I SAM-dependent methyltransferase [Gammaproteobacteria bacterium]